MSIPRIEDRKGCCFCRACFSIQNVETVEILHGSALARRQHCQGSLTSELSFPAEGAESAGWPYNIKSQIRFWRMAPESSPCNTIWHILIVAGRWQDAGKLRWIDESVHCTSAPCRCKYYLVNAAAEQSSCSCSSGVC